MLHKVDKREQQTNYITRRYPFKAVFLFSLQIPQFNE
jgi:hypothetical protein